MQSYPSMTRSEFSQACQTLERCCQGRLDGSNWSFVRWNNDELIIRERREIAIRILNENEDECAEMDRSEIEELDEVTRSLFILPAPGYLTKSRKQWTESPICPHRLSR